MKSSIIAFITFGLLLTFVQCTNKQHVSQYIIEEGLLSGGRTYDIKTETVGASKFTIENAPMQLRRVLTLSEDGVKRFTITHELVNLLTTWVISAPSTGRELGRATKRLTLYGSTIDIKGEFGTYDIEGNYGNLEYTISKDKRKRAAVDKKSYYLHNTYGVTAYDGVDDGLMILFAIIIDEMRNHKK